MADIAAKRGHEPRPHDGGRERRPSKAPEIMRVQLLGREFVARILEVRQLESKAAENLSAAEARLIDS